MIALSVATLVGAACSGAANVPSATEVDHVESAVDDPLLRWPLPPGAERYAAIDGRRLHRYVVEQAEIARRHRDEVEEAQ